MKRVFSATLTLLILFTFSTPAHASFPDVPENHYNYTAINYVQAEGIVSGNPDGTYKPDLKIDRAAFTKIIIESKYTPEQIEACGSADFKDLPAGIWYDKYVCVAQRNKVIDGYPDGTFGGEKLINLAEASKIISNAFGYETQPDTVTWYKPYIEQLSQHRALPMTLTGFDHQLTRGEMAEIVYRLLARVGVKNSTNYYNLSQGIYLPPEELPRLLIQDGALLYISSIEYLRRQMFTAYQDYWDFFNVNNGFEPNIEAIEPELSKAIYNIKSLREEVLKIPPHEGNDSLMEGVLNEFNLIIGILDQDAHELNELYAGLKEKENLTEEEKQIFHEEVENLLALIHEDFSSAEEMYFNASLKFSESYGLKLFYYAASDYAVLLTGLYQNAFEEYLAYVDFLNQENVDGDLIAMENNRQEALLSIKQLKYKIASTESYENDNTLLNAVTTATDVLIGILEKEAQELISLRHEYQGGQNEKTIEEFNAQDKAITDSANQKMNLSQNMVYEAHKDFATRYNFIDSLTNL